MNHENDRSADVAFEAYSQNLFLDMAQELMLERSKRLLAENRLYQVTDDAVVVVRSLHKYKERITELEREVKHDPLTGLLEKTAWTDEVEGMIASGKHFAIVYIDLTNFKWVNDTISHHEGDRILIDFGDMLLQTTRASQLEDKDIITLEEAPHGLEGDAWAGRLGGDEFALLIDLTPRNNFQLTDEKRLEKVIERLHKTCGNFLNNEPELRYGGFNFAIGGTIRKPDDTAEDVIRRAEKNMYTIKRRQHKQSGPSR